MKAWMRPLLATVTLAGFSACLLTDEPDARNDSDLCPITEPQPASQTGGVGFVIKDTLHWEILHADNSSLVFSKVRCPPPGNGGAVMYGFTNQILVQKLPLTFGDSLVWFDAGFHTANIHDFRKNDSLPYELYSRTAKSSDGNGPCSQETSRFCFGNTYTESFVFFKDHVLRIAAPPDFILQDRPTRQLFRDLTFGESPLASPHTVDHLKYHRDNVHESMKDSIPRHLFAHYPSDEDVKWVTAVGNRVKSPEECETYPGMSFLFVDFCKHRYRVLHPLE